MVTRGSRCERVKSSRRALKALFDHFTSRLLTSSHVVPALAQSAYLPHHHSLHFAQRFEINTDKEINKYVLLSKYKKYLHHHQSILDNFFSALTLITRVCKAEREIGLLMVEDGAEIAR